MDWSPFYCLPKAELTPSGLVKIDEADHEVLLLRRSDIEFRHEGPTPMAPRPRGLPSSQRWKNVTENHVLALTLTTHRFVLLHRKEVGDNVDSNASITNDARFVHMSNVKSVVAKGGPSLMSPNASYKLSITTQTYDELILVFRSGKKDDRDQTLREFQKALDRKRWEVSTRLQEQTAKSNATLGNRVGLDRILAKNKLRHEENAKLAEDALSGDSENLLQEAAGLLKVIQKYKVMVQKFDGNASNNNEDEEAAAKLNGLLSDMGMTSALSQSRGAGNKKNNRRDYHELTARQVADFLIPRLQRKKSGSGSMMSLTDVYCLFNRARGSNLISPEDLMASCALLGKEIKVGLSMRTFPSGVVVMQLDDDSALSPTNYEARRIMIDLCNNAENSGTSALEASHTLKLSPLLASEQLEEAERLGWLCRDVTISGVRFFPNKFETTFV